MEPLGRRWAPWECSIVAALTLVGVWTLRQGFNIGNDAVSYWSAAREASEWRIGRSGLVPAFSDLDFRAVLTTSTAPLVDFPVGYPLVIGTLGALVGLDVARALVTLGAVALLVWGILHGPRRIDRWETLAVRTTAAALAVSFPIAVEVRQSALPEPLFTAGLVWFVITLLSLRNGHSSPLAAGAIGGLLGLLRFVGLTLVVIVLVEAWRCGHRGKRLVAAAALCVVPGALNAWMAARVTGRSPQWMDRGWIDAKFAAHAVAGWFVSFRTSVGAILEPGWSVPLPYYLLAAAALGAIGVGAVVWARRGATSGPAPLALAVAAALLGSVVVTMLSYDALTKFEPRMLYPVGVLVVVAAAWSTPRARVKHVTTMCAWLLAAGGPWAWPTAGAPSYPEWDRLVQTTGAQAIVSTSADVAHYVTALPAAYFPPDIYVHSGRPRDRSELMAGLPCALHAASGIAVIDLEGFLPVDPWIGATLSEQRSAGDWSVARVENFEVYLPTGIDC